MITGKNFKRMKVIDKVVSQGDTVLFKRYIVL